MKLTEPYSDSLARWFLYGRLLRALRLAQADRACGTHRDVSPNVRAIMSRFWYRMAEATKGRR